MSDFIYKILFFFFLTLLTSCSQTTERTISKGPAIYGDTLRLSTPDPIESLFPLFNTDVYSHRVTAKIFEPLFEINTKTSKVEPRLVERYTWNKNRRVLTLTLRKDIEFHEDPCFGNESRRMTAYDVKYTLDFACSKTPFNQSNDALVSKIEGANQYYNSGVKSPTENGVSGIRVINDDVIKIFLNAPYSNFLTLLTSSKYAIFSKIAYTHYQEQIASHPIGTGPFMISKLSPENILLTYHPYYWRHDKYGNRLPYLNAVNYKVYQNKNEEVKAFQEQQVDLLYEVPSQNLNALMGGLSYATKKKTFAHKVIVIPGSRVSLLAFSNNFAPFKDQRVRKAIDLIVNRDYIANEILNGDGIPAKKGFAPNSPYYNNTLLQNKEIDVVRAKKLFASAGYNGQHPFPKVDLFVAGDAGSSTVKYCEYIATEIKKQLGISIAVHACSTSERDAAIFANKAHLWKIGWAPDYPDPETYFSLFYSKNPREQYYNPFFPKLNSAIYNFNYEMGIIESDPGLKNNYFTNCDAILQEESWVMPILYEDYVMIVNLRCRNIKINPMGFANISECYIKPL